MVIISIELTRVEPNKLWIIYFITLQRFGLSPSPSFEWIDKLHRIINSMIDESNGLINSMDR